VAKNMMAARHPSRRRMARLPIECHGSLRGRQPRPVKVLDLSASGCLVRCGERLDTGAIFDLEVHLEARAVTSKVRVTNWCVDGSVAGQRAFLAGLEFVGLSAEEEASLRRFLEDERRRRRSADAAAL
jgi:hypothetical protein